MLPKKEPESFESQLLRSCPALGKWQRLHENDEQSPDDEEEGGDERVPAGDPGPDMGGPDDMGDDMGPESEPEDDGDMEDMGGGPDQKGDVGGDVDSKLKHPIDPNDPAMIAHEIGELKTLCDKGKTDLVKKQLHHLWQQVKHLDKIHDADDEAIADM